MYEPERPSSKNELEAKKREEIERLCEGTPEALYILSGITEKIDPKSGQKSYRPGSYADVDWKGFLSGSKARALAAVELAKYFPDTIIAVNSNTYNINDSSAPTDATVMSEYIENKGVNPERIIRQDKSISTFTELIELIKYIHKHAWNHVVVVTNEFQIPRAKEMLKQIETLKDPASAWQDPVFRAAVEYLKATSPKITFVSAEDILPLRDARYAALIKEAKTTETWKRREAVEEKAVTQLRGGNYWK